MLANLVREKCNIKDKLNCLNVCDIRVLRPFSYNTVDNNPLHRDTWIKEINNAVNIWIPVVGVNEHSSLSLIPGSHLWDDDSSVKRTTNNAFIERFNGSYRRGVLDRYIFETIDQVREQSQIWMNDYNNFRPHEALGNTPPSIYAKINN